MPGPRPTCPVRMMPGCTMDAAAVSAFHRASGPAARPRATSSGLAGNWISECPISRVPDERQRTPSGCSHDRASARAHQAHVRSGDRQRAPASGRKPKPAGKNAGPRPGPAISPPPQKNATRKARFGHGASSAGQPRRRRPAARQEKTTTARRLPPVGSRIRSRFSEPECPACGSCRSGSP